MYTHHLVGAGKKLNFPNNVTSSRSKRNYAVQNVSRSKGSSQGHADSQLHPAGAPRCSRIGSFRKLGQGFTRSFPINKLNLERLYNDAFLCYCIRAPIGT